VTVSGQWLGKHGPIARQQIVNKATVGCNNKRTVFFMWFMLRCYKQGTKSEKYKRLKLGGGQAYDRSSE
jgi:hypothetical protein